MKLSAQEKKYTSEFSLENFLEVIPDPVGYFGNKNRPSPINPSQKSSSASSKTYHDYRINFFRNNYNHISLKDITSILRDSKTLTEAGEKLDKFTKLMRTKRKQIPLPSCDNIPLLQEVRNCYDLS